MKPSKRVYLEAGAMTIPMDIGSEAFKDFQLFIKSKSMSQTEDQRKLNKLMALKIQIEDSLLNENQENTLISES